MYSEIILDYYRNPRNYGTITEADTGAHDVNPLCGDEVEIALKIKSGRIEEAKFSGKGCAISQAAASMLCERIEGRKIEEILKMPKEEMLELLGIKLSPARLKCALLGLKVVKLAMYKHVTEAK